MKEQFTFFYGGPFSNWLTCDFVVEGRKYVSTEQFMMAEKSRLFGDKDAEDAIMKTRDPQTAKICGRKVKGFNEKIWNEKARDIVYKGCYAKFQQNAGLKIALMETKGTTLVEASQTDQIWGIGLEADDHKAEDRSQWRGTNWLGEVLNKVRDDLDAGVYRTQNFEWSDHKISVYPVKISNKTGKELWIWDNDNIRRAASELAHTFNRIEEIEVVVNETKHEHKPTTHVEIRVNCEHKHDFVASGEADHGEVLTAFRDAIHKMRRQLHDYKEKIQCHHVS